MSEDNGKFSLDRLIKLLKMTTVSEDTLCCVAIRKANEELSRIGTDWDSLLRGKVTIVQDPFNSIPEPKTPYRDQAKPTFKTPQQPQDWSYLDPNPKAAPPTKPKKPSFPFGPPPYTPPQYTPPKPQPSPARRVVNRFAGPCRICKATVAAGNGFAIQVNHRWLVECDPVDCGKHKRTRGKPSVSDLGGLAQ